ncbi:MAG: class I SAM-dependent methyltransferase [Acidimicrobiales bacterium]
MARRTSIRPRSVRRSTTTRACSTSRRSEPLGGVRSPGLHQPFPGLDVVARPLRRRKTTTPPAAACPSTTSTLPAPVRGGAGLGAHRHPGLGSARHRVRHRRRPRQELRDEGWDVVGVEPDGDMAEVAWERFGLEATTGMFEDDTFPGEQFDLAYSCHVWEHLADPVATSAAAHALLAPTGGHLMIVVPTFRKATTLAWSCFTAPHTYMFTDVSLGNVLDQAGFDVVDHAYVGAADSELWLLAKARPEPGPTRVEPVAEDPAKVQRELALVPLRLPLGVAGRVRSHVRTLASDPKDFVDRLGRWAGRRAERLKRTVTRS